MSQIPDCSQIFANEYATTVYIKNVVKAPNIEVGDYSYYEMPRIRRSLRSAACSLTIRNIFRISSSSGNSAPLLKVCNS